MCVDPHRSDGIHHHRLRADQTIPRLACARRKQYRVHHRGVSLARGDRGHAIYAAAMGLHGYDPDIGVGHCTFASDEDQHGQNMRIEQPRKGLLYI